jgi:hypothetical protein
MKFISKNSNLRIVLRPGLPAAPLAGRDAMPGIYVKFQDGIAEVKDEEYIKMMLRHPAFNSDFIAPDNGIDPFAHRRSEIEPAHVIQEMKYGTVVGVQSSAKRAPLSPEMKKMINDLAEARMKEILPSAIEHAVKQMAELGRQNKHSDVNNNEEYDLKNDSLYPVRTPQAVEANSMMNELEESDDGSMYNEDGDEIDGKTEVPTSKTSEESVKKPGRGRPAKK